MSGRKLLTKMYIKCAIFRNLRPFRVLLLLNNNNNNLIDIKLVKLQETSLH